MKYVCKLDDKSCVVSERTFQNAAVKAFRRLGNHLEEHEIGTVHVMDENYVKRFFNIQQKFKHESSIQGEYKSWVEPYSFESIDKASNPYEACVAALKHVAEEITFDGDEFVTIETENSDGETFSYKFHIVGPEVSYVERNQ